jgi:hypothetical protein
VICADFLDGARMEDGNPEVLVQSLSRYYRLLPTNQQGVFLSEISGQRS